MKVSVIYKKTKRNGFLNNICLTDGCLDYAEEDSRYCKKCRRNQRVNSKAWAERRQESLSKKKQQPIETFHFEEEVIGGNYLYAIFAENLAVKFGITYNLRKRKQMLQTSNHLALKLEAYIKCKPEIEPLVHKYCKKAKIRGEWFHINSTTLEIITLMKTKDLQGLYTRLGFSTSQ